MKERKVTEKILGRPTMDGAGVHLVRVLGPKTMYDFDPFLMLDSFDSKNPEDYIKGFPWHPHRGIETITYLAMGEMEHGDSLGHKGTILAEQSQWMTAGSGIIHQELPKPTERLLGLQFWLNLPKEKKMVEPHYFEIGESQIGKVTEDGVSIKVIAGEYKGIKGVQAPHIPATLYDVEISVGKELLLPIKEEDTAFVFLLDGSGEVAGEWVDVKTAVLLEDGDAVSLKATKEPLRVVFASAPPLHEPIAWGGPIVMNTDDELEEAFEDLDNNTFIK